MGEEQLVGVDHAGGVDLAGGERPGRVALAADVVAVQPDADVERAGPAKSPPGLQARAAQERQRDQRRLRRVDRAGRDHLAAQIRRRLRSASRARTTTTDVRSRSVSRIRPGARSRPAPAARRRARIQASGEFHASVDRPGDQVLDLALVVRVQDEVERQACSRSHARKPSQIVTTFGS